MSLLTDSGMLCAVFWWAKINFSATDRDNSMEKSSSKEAYMNMATVRSFNQADRQKVPRKRSAR